VKQLYLNLPVKNLEKSQAFYEALGFVINPVFTDDVNQKCLVWSDHIYVMLQSLTFTAKHVKKPHANFQHVSGPSFTLPLESFADINKLAEKGLAAGGKESIPMIDEGFMQVRTLEDPDGHTWGLLYLDLEKFKSLR
jgi:predicted lactoylglutathione lyase